MVDRQDEAARTARANDGYLWECYNSLLLGPDTTRIRKLLARYSLFAMVLDVPGDIVECGVFKGAGLMYWAKLLEIFAPNSRKRVIGFDVFAPFQDVPLHPSERAIAARHDDLAGAVGKGDVADAVEAAGLSRRVQLVKGDVAQTAARYVEQSYGARVSLLHLDLDTYEGTSAALAAFWPIVSRGGVVVFDEYAVPGMGESRAVDEFFADTGLRPIVVPHAETPTAYVVKP